MSRPPVVESRFEYSNMLRGVPPGWQRTRCVVPTVLRGAESIRRMIYIASARAGRTFFCSYFLQRVRLLGGLLSRVFSKVSKRTFTRVWRAPISRGPLPLPRRRSFRAFFYSIIARAKDKWYHAERARLTLLFCFFN